LRQGEKLAYMNTPVVLAAAAHPDDIEFLFAGTLLLLKEAGCEIHMWNLADGSLGSITSVPEETTRIRWDESQASAREAGAKAHPSLFGDMAVFYDADSLARTAAVVRSIRPQIILTHSLNDYMEDHQNTARLVVSSAFGRGMPYFRTKPVVPPYSNEIRVYHAPPHGLRDGMGVPFSPDFLIDIDSVVERKRRMLACHRSQAAWLEVSQKMDSYLAEMEIMCGTLAAGTELAFTEGWRRHCPLGFCPSDFDPLPRLLAPFIRILKP
jgi:N-acetylglucosamine malate deacetylase 1